MQNFIWVELQLLGESCRHVPGKIAMEYLECRIRLLIQYQQCPCPVTNMQGHAVTKTVSRNHWWPNENTYHPKGYCSHKASEGAGWGLEPLLYHPFGVLCQGSMEHADRLLMISRPWKEPVYFYSCLFTLAENYHFRDIDRFFCSFKKWCYAIQIALEIK